MSVNTSELRSLAINASPGPWRNGADFLHYMSPEVTDDKTFSYYVTTDNDAAFIAAANPLTVIEMVDELATLRARLASSDLEWILLRAGLYDALAAWQMWVEQEYAGTRFYDRGIAEISRLRKLVSE